MQKLLIICGPTATGKTLFALEVAKKFNGEIISADSRQVYTGMDIVTGKDLPRNAQCLMSNVQWKNKRLSYYDISGIKIWLYDVVNPDESFNVSYWKECADLVISDIHKRNKLPIVVGGTGLYIKSLTQNLDQISISPNQKLREDLADKNPEYLFNYLNQLNPSLSAKINASDRHNPRRLIRAIEISLTSKLLVNSQLSTIDYQLFQIGLTAPLDTLYSRIDNRVDAREALGAAEESKIILSRYDRNLPSLTASGYRAFLDSNPISKWKTLEHQYARRQLTWFKKQPGIHWFDISVSNWQPFAVSLINNWYNN